METEVRPVSNDPPIEGNPYWIECLIIDGNPEASHFQWKDEAENSNILHLNKLDKDRHSKQYMCTGVNAAGSGEYGKELQISVWCKISKEYLFSLLTILANAKTFITMIQ